MTAGAEWAARYAAGGLQVLPLHSFRDGRCTCRRGDCLSPAKHPLTAHGKDDATADLGQIGEWWGRWPWANVGILPPVGVAVLDVDPRHGGSSALLALTRRHGALPQTLTARTGSGGLHIWLGYAGPTVGKLCRGVDVKTSTGYLVAPPSLHVSGRRYEWIAELSTAVAPRWVRRLLAPARPAVVIPRFGVGGEKKIDHLVQFVAESPDGERNNRLYWASVRAHEAGLDTAPLIAAAVAIGYPELAAVRTAKSAAKAPARRSGARR